MRCDHYCMVSIIIKVIKYLVAGPKRYLNCTLVGQTGEYLRNRR